MRILLLVLIASLVLLPAVAADRVVYFVVNPAFPDNTLVGALQEIGFTVDITDNADIATVNWDDYDFMLIGDQVFANELAFPVNDFPAIILNTNYMDEWHWSSRTSQKTSSIPLKTHINDEDHIIASGLTGNVPIYTTSAGTVNYLHRYYRDPDIKAVTATSNSSFWDTLNAVIATVEPGAVIRDNVVSNVKGVFFGIEQTQYWTPQAKQLFQNSAIWLTTDFYPPAYSNVQITALTNHSVTITWDTDKLSTTSLTIDGSQYNVSGLRFSHSIDVSGLAEDSYYEFILSGCNADGYCGSSGTYDLTTADETAPSIIDFSVTGVTDTEATINAEWDEYGYFTVWYGPANLHYESPPSSPGTTDSITLTVLSDKTNYHYRVQACDDSGNCRNSSTQGFTTFDFTDPQMPQNLLLEVGPSGLNVVATWDAPLDDATSWNVYIGDTPDTIDYNTIYATTTTTTYSDSSAPGERYYVIRAADDAGNEEENTFVMGRFALDLDYGYNLVSLPLEPFDSSIDAVMHQNSFYHPVSEIKAWDNVAQDFVAAVYDSGWTGFTDLTHGEGYFFKAESAGPFLFTGVPPTTPTRQMRTGMNLIGANTLMTQEFTDLITQTSGDVKAREIAYRNGGGRFTVSTYTDTWNNAFSIMPGEGYWLKAEQEFMI